MSVGKFISLLICITMSWISLTILGVRALIQKRRKKDIFVETSFDLFEDE